MNFKELIDYIRSVPLSNTSLTKWYSGNRKLANNEILELSTIIKEHNIRMIDLPDKDIDLTGLNALIKVITFDPSISIQIPRCTLWRLFENVNIKTKMSATLLPGTADFNNLSAAFGREVMQKMMVDRECLPSKDETYQLLINVAESKNHHLDVCGFPNVLNSIVYNYLDTDNLLTLCGEISKIEDV